MTKRSDQTARSVIVTGAGSGIGRATARRFAECGANVLIVARSAGGLAETAAGYDNIASLPVDLTQPDSPARIVATACELFGRIDVVVNNAAITRPAMLGAIDPDVAGEQIATNLIAPLLLTQEALPHLKSSSGVIVNVTSNPPQRGWPRNSVYGATKTALDFLTFTWALELAPHGVRVVSVAPGPTDTQALRDAHAGLTPAEREARADRVPLGRRAEAEEVAWWIATAAGPRASYLTGTVLRVDGGTSVA